MSFGDWYALALLGGTAALGIGWVIVDFVRERRRYRCRTDVIVAEVTDLRARSLARVDLPPRRAYMRAGGPRKVVADAGCEHHEAPASATFQRRAS